MRGLATMLVIGSALLLVTTWFGYPLILRLSGGGLPRRLGGAPHGQWPTVTIVVVVRNAESQLRQLLQNLLGLAYPPDRRHILVVSDASTDFTDAVAGVFEPKGVSVLRTMWPRGTATALNIARRFVRSDITVVVEPTARLRPWSLAALVAPFTERSVGVVYGRDVPAENGPARIGDQGWYWRYESRLRDLETRVFGTVSARGSLYAVRTPLFRAPVAAWLNPDFSTTLTAREHGYRAVFEEDAECVVARATSVKWTYEPTVSALARDLATLLYKPHLLNPRRFGAFAWMLLGHKLGHWMTPWSVLAGLIGLALLAPVAPWAAFTLAALGGIAALSLVVALALRFPARRVARAFALPGKIAANVVAFAHATLRTIWEPAADRPAPFPPINRRMRAVSSGP